MYKDLLDYNGTFNTWARENRTEAVGIGLGLNVVVLFVTGMVIRKEWKKETK